MTRVLFIIRKLAIGGAERQLLELVRNLDRRAFDIHLLCFYPGGDLWEEARSLRGIHVDHVGKSSRWSVTPLARIFGHIRRLRPHIVHGYMDVANISALVGKPFGAKVVWGIRASQVEMSHYDCLRRLARAFESRLSPFADLIICNSAAAASQLIERRYPAARIVVIPNGIDSTRFRFDPVARDRIRAEWGVGAEHFLIGLVARMDPMKGHGVFLQAARRVASQHARARFAFVGGGGDDTYRRRVSRQVDELGLRGKVIQAGARGDIPGVLSALDLSVSASLFGEGFSNTLAESMACGVQCLATDVGDSAKILGDLGRLVSPGDYAGMAQHMCAALEESPGLVSRDRLRGRIELEFASARLAQNTASALRALHCERADAAVE